MAPVGLDDIEVKPDGIVYLPEIKYRRILNKAFGPGAWGLAPRGETIVTAKAVTREYALVALGRFVSQASSILIHITHAYLLELGSYLLPVANKITFLPKASQRLSKAASPMHSCGVAKTLA